MKRRLPVGTLPFVAVRQECSPHLCFHATGGGGTFGSRGGAEIFEGSRRFPERGSTIPHLTNLCSRTEPTGETSPATSAVAGRIPRIRRIAGIHSRFF